MKPYRNLDFIMSLRKKELVCGKTWKILQLLPSQRIIKIMFLIAAENYELPLCCRVSIYCQIVDEEVSKTRKTETIIEPMKTLESKSPLLIAGTPNEMVDTVL